MQYIFTSYIFEKIPYLALDQNVFSYSALEFFLPYLTLDLNFVPYTTLQFILFTNSVKWHLKIPFCPMAHCMCFNTLFCCPQMSDLWATSTWLEKQYVFLHSMFLPVPSLSFFWLIGGRGFTTEWILSLISSPAKSRRHPRRRLRWLRAYVMGMAI
jgi:hypothetical protein